MSRSAEQQQRHRRADGSGPWATAAAGGATGASSGRRTFGAPSGRSPRRPPAGWSGSASRRGAQRGGCRPSCPSCPWAAAAAAAPELHQESISVRTCCCTEHVSAGTSALVFLGNGARQSVHERPAFEDWTSPSSARWWPPRQPPSAAGSRRSLPASTDPAIAELGVRNNIDCG